MRVKHLAKKSLVNSTNNLFIQLFRYVFVGGFAYLVDWGTMYLLMYYMSVPYLWAASGGFILGLAVNYIISRYWIFQQSQFKSRTLEFVSTGLIGLVGLFLNGLFIWILVEYFGVLPIWAKPLAAVPIFLWNFLGRRLLVFRTRPTENDTDTLN